MIICKITSQLMKKNLVYFAIYVIRHMPTGGLCVHTKEIFMVLLGHGFCVSAARSITPILSLGTGEHVMLARNISGSKDN